MKLRPEEGRERLKSCGIERNRKKIVNGCSSVNCRVISQPDVMVKDKQSGIYRARRCEDLRTLSWV